MAKPDGGPIHPGADKVKIAAAYTELVEALRAQDEARVIAVVQNLLAATHPGMSLRDYFAGQALAGLCAGSQCAPEPSGICRLAVEIADAMIAARERA